MTNNTDRLPGIKAHFEGVLAQEPRADLTALRLDQLEWLIAELEQTRTRCERLEADNTHLSNRCKRLETLVKSVDVLQHHREYKALFEAEQ